MSTKIEQDRLDAFLIALTNLCNQHQIGIGGCGCCGSPELYNRDEVNMEDFKNLRYKVTPHVEKEDDGEIRYTYEYLSLQEIPTDAP